MQVAELQLEKGMDEGGEVQQKPASSVSEARVTGQPEHILRTWRWNEDIPKAGLITFKAGIGYLLCVKITMSIQLRVASWAIKLMVSEYRMIAVMTGNVGYFLSVLGGIFVGELAGGRYASYV